MSSSSKTRVADISKALGGIVWASPTTLLALIVGGICLLFGSRLQRKRYGLEFYGGPIAWILSKTPIGACAMTLGHVIWGRTTADLERARDHEWVHVKQYERWGPFFLPAYLGCSFWLWCRGKNAYLDNPFEIEAYEADLARVSDLTEQEREE